MPVAARFRQLLTVAAGETPDADLLARFVRARDELAFAELVRRHGPTVFRVCRRVAGPSAHDDASQATFLVLALRAKAVRKGGSVASWLVGVAGRVARQMRRGETRRARRETAAADSDRSGEGVSTNLELAEFAAALDDELTRLPDSLRGPVVQCLLAGRTHEQAAAELGSSPRTLRRRLEQAKGLLRLRLERRGIVPAVAAGLVAGIGDGVAAVPPAVGRAAVAGVFDFLAGGAVTPAAAVAKGVAGGMTVFKLKGVAAAVAVVLAGVGIGWGGGGPSDKPGPPPPANTPTAFEAPKADAPPPKPADKAASAGPRFQTANFVVTAPTAEVARAVAAEAEHQRKVQGERWLGKEPGPWPKPHPIQVTTTGATSIGVSTFEYGKDADGKPTVRFAETELKGELRYILAHYLPREVTQVLLVQAFRRPLPRWAGAGIPPLSEPHAEQARLDEQCREVLKAGRGFRLRVLFKMTDAPRDADEFAAEAHSVCRFLLTRPLTDYVPADPLREGRGRNTRPVQRNPHTELVDFVVRGMDTDWAKAAKEVYWFDSIDNLEDAWLSWLRTPESRAMPDPVTAVPPPLKDDGSDRIPPADYSGPVVPPPAVPTHTTRNFVVTAPTPEMARAIGAEAEVRRKALAEEWLGKELPPAPKPVPIRVEIKIGSSGGATTFTFGQGADGKPVLVSSEMLLRGEFREVLSGNLPHEITHVILAHHFARPVPRWADEGIAQLAEPHASQVNQDVKSRELLNAGKGFRLRTLLAMTEYPKDMSILYAQGHSVCRFLIDLGYRRKRIADWALYGPGSKTAGDELMRGANADLLDFVRRGLEGNTAESWDRAAKAVYEFESVDKLEGAWLDWLRAPESRLKYEPALPPAPPAKPAGEPDRIPPANIPGLAAARPPAPAGRTAEYATANFVVTATTPEAARAVGEEAEKLRKALAKQWLGGELPASPKPFPVRVRIVKPNEDHYWGITYDDGQKPDAKPAPVTGTIDMTGRLTFLLESALPSLVMDLVLAQHFGKPPPGWARYGIAMHMGTPAEQKNELQRLQNVLTQGRGLRLKFLLPLGDYPTDTNVPGIQGFSLVRFLEPRKDRPTVVRFVEAGLADGWDAAAKAVYGFADVADLERAWFDALRAEGLVPAPKPELIPPAGLPRAETKVGFAAPVPADRRPLIWLRRAGGLTGVDPDGRVRAEREWKGSRLDGWVSPAHNLLCFDGKDGRLPDPIPEPNRYGVRELTGLTLHVRPLDDPDAPATDLKVQSSGGPHYLSSSGRTLLAREFRPEPGRAGLAYSFVDVVTGKKTPYDLPDAASKLGGFVQDIAPDRSWILCFENARTPPNQKERVPQARLHKVPLDGGPPVLLTGRLEVWYGRVSPDGRRVLCHGRAEVGGKWYPGHGGAYVIDVATQVATKISGPEDQDYHWMGAWSPDGRAVAYAWREAVTDPAVGPPAPRPPTRLVVCDADGTNARTVYESAAGSLPVAWW